MDLDLNRANFRAVTAQARRITEVLIILHPTHMRCNYRADGATVRRIIRVAAYVFVDWTGVKACAATDAIQALALLFLSQQIGSAIIEQDDVHFLWPVGFIGLARAADDGVVYGKVLSGAVRSQQGPIQTQIGYGWDDLLDTYDSDMYFRESSAKPRP